MTSAYATPCVCLAATVPLLPRSGSDCVAEVVTDPSLSIGANSYTYTIAGDSNRLSTTTGPAPAKTNIHDPAGNLTGDGTVTYGYDARGRMVQATIARMEFW